MTSWRPASWGPLFYLRIISGASSSLVGHPASLRLDGFEPISRHVRWGRHIVKASTALFGYRKGRNCGNAVVWLRPRNGHRANFVLPIRARQHAPASTRPIKSRHLLACPGRYGSNQCAHRPSSIQSSSVPACQPAPVPAGQRCHGNPAAWLQRLTALHPVMASDALR